MSEGQSQAKQAQAKQDRHKRSRHKRSRQTIQVKTQAQQADNYKDKGPQQASFCCPPLP